MTKIVFICVGIILLVSIITYAIGMILEYRRKKIINEMNKVIDDMTNEN